MEIPRWMVCAIKHFSFTKPLLVLTLLSICLLGCKKDKFKNLAPELVGEWEWYQSRVCQDVPGGVDCYLIDASYSYSMVIGKRCKIECYQNGSLIETKSFERISELQPGYPGYYYDEGYHGYYFLWEDEDAEFSDVIFFKEGCIACTRWPIDEDGLGGHVGFFRKK